MAETVKELTIGLNVNAHGLEKGLKQVNENIRNLGFELKKSSSDTNSFEGKVQSLSQKIDIMNKMVVEQKTKLSLLTSDYDKHSEKTDMLRQDYTKAIEIYKENVRALEDMKDAGLENTDAYKQLSDEVVKNKQAMDSLGVAYDKSQAQLDKMGNNINKTAGEVTKFETNLKKASAELSALPFQHASEKLTTLGNSLQDTGKKINSVGKKLTALSLPLLLIGKSSVNFASEFEESITKTGALAQATEEEFDELRQTSINMGEAISGASGKDVADAFGYLALAGYDVNKMLEAVEPNVKASIAWGEEMAHNTDLVTDSLSALGKDSAYTTEYLDKLTNAQNNCNSTGQQFLEAFVGAGGMFRDWNTPMSESIALVGILANRGIKGEQHCPILQ